MSKWEKKLQSLYSTPGKSGAFSSADKLYRILRNEGFTMSKKQIQNWLNTQHVYTIHKRRIANFKRNSVIAQYPDHNWQADILFLQDIATFNDNKPCMFVCIDVVSRYAWAEPMKSKKGTETAKAFEKIMTKAGRQPEKLQTDKGSEFYNKDFKKILNTRCISLYSTESDKKAAIAERCIKEIKKLVYRFMTMNQTNRYIDHLQALMDTYNSTFHSSIGMSPENVDESTLSTVLENLYGHLWAADSSQPVAHPHLSVGDKVRISISKDLFQKGYKGYWTNEVFYIHSIRHHHPHIMYQLRDMDEQIVKGAFYEKELQKVHPESERFTKIKKIIRKKFIKGKLWYLVTWENEPVTTKRWIPASSIIE
jgi:hypothetical protein